MIVSFIDYLVGRFSGVYAPAIRPTYIKKSARSIDYLDTYKREVVRVLAERTVNNYFNSLSKQQIGAATTTRGGYYYGRADDEIFGFRAVICERCLCMDALQVYFTNDDPKVARAERRHSCNPQWIAANESELTAEERQESVSRIRGELASYIANVASVWTACKPSLIAFKLTNPSSSNSIKIRHPAAPADSDSNKTITLQQSQEGIIGIDMFNDIDASRWVGRAIMEKQTALNEKELVNFCKYAGGKTFGFFKIGGVKEEETGPLIYLMAITNLQWKRSAANQDRATDSKMM